jgi:uncharacterized protein with FMN-binding domain
MLILCFLLAAAAAFFGCQGSPPEVQVSMPSMSAIPDGAYRGTAKVFPVLVAVEVTVSGGRITEFTILKHRHGRGKAAEALAAQVVARQSIELDAVSGATISSRAILKAGENALRSALP